MKFLLFTLLIFTITPFLTAQKKKNQEFNPEYIHTLIEANRQKVLGNFETVKYLYEKCIEINPESAVAYYELASYYIQKNDFNKAILLTQKAIKLSPDNIWYNALLGVLYKQNQQYNKAIQVYKKITKINPSLSDFWYELAYSYMYAGKLTKALKTFDIIEQKYGLNEIICLERERIYTFNRNYEKANEQIKKLINAYPSEIRYLGMLAESYVAQNKLIEAEKIYNQMLEVDSTNGLVNLSLSEFYRIKQNYNQSFYYLRKAFRSQDIDIDLKIKMLITLSSYANKDKFLSIQVDSLIDILMEKYSEEPKVLMLKADIFLKNNKINDAYQYLLKIINKDPSKYFIWEQIFMIEYQNSMWDSLYIHTKQAIELFPEQTNLYYFFAIAAYNKEKFEEANNSLEKALELPVQNNDLLIEIYALQGDILHKMGKNAESDRALEKALKIDRNNKIILNNYSYYLANRSDSLDKAYRMSLLCIELEPDNPSFLDTHAWVLYKLGKYSDALKYIEKAYNLQKNNSTIIEHYGDILYKLGEIDKAVELWKEAQKVGKSNLRLEQKIIERKLIK